MKRKRDDNDYFKDNLKKRRIEEKSSQSSQSSPYLHSVYSTLDLRVAPSSLNLRVVQYTIDEQWMAISKSRNASLQDYCLDYFKMYNISDIDDVPERKEKKEIKY